MKARELHTLGTQMQQVFDAWSMQLDMLDGMVRQAVERGWTEEQARRIVAGTFGGHPQGEEDDT